MNSMKAIIKSEFVKEACFAAVSIYTWVACTALHLTQAMHLVFPTIVSPVGGALRLWWGSMITIIGILTVAGEARKEDRRFYLIGIALSTIGILIMKG